MTKDNIKRNSLDYILTDLLPVELSELFTFHSFYNFLIDKQKDIDRLSKSVIAQKNKTNASTTLFDDGKRWASMPLKYSIMKSTDASRVLNVVQPIAAIQIYLFISAYEKEILNFLDQNSVYSIRYHTRNNRLYYKQKQKSLIHYFSDTAEELDKEIIQQTGVYFDIQPFRSIVDYTDSDIWFDLTLKYRYFAKLDYQSCFDSVYTHTYKWMISKDTNDSIQFRNTNLFTTIDRIMQNINARTSNGIIIGPEFSRMIAEILLQGIDMKIFNELLNQRIVLGQNYHIARYVDDLYIFADSEKLLNTIILLYRENSKKYLLQLNESKMIRETLPFIISPWLKDINDYAIDLSNTVFYSITELSHNEKETAFKASMFWKRSSVLKRNFNDIVCNYENKSKTLVAYALGTVLRKVDDKTYRKFKLFNDNISNKRIYAFLDYLFFIFSYCPCFDNAQRLISILSYLNDEIDFSSARRSVLQQIIERYSHIFDNANVNDTVNLILLCAKYKIEIPFQTEKKLVDKIDKEDNPVVWASYLLYSKYDSQYFIETLTHTEEMIHVKMESILKKDNIFTYREFWWLLIFNKCPFISPTTQDCINQIIDDNVKIASPTNSVHDHCINLVADYLRNCPIQFFHWDLQNLDILKQITYRTHQRTVFRNYKYGKIEYTSI